MVSVERDMVSENTLFTSFQFSEFGEKDVGATEMVTQTKTSNCQQTRAESAKIGWNKAL